MAKSVRLKSIQFGGNKPFVLIAGPCVIEDKKTVMVIAEKLVDMTTRLLRKLLQ